MLAELTSGDLGRFLVGVTISGGLSTLVFWHASKHGNRRATAWAVCAFLAAGLVVPVYFFLYWWRTRRK